MTIPASQPSILLINPGPLAQSSQARATSERYPYPPLGLLYLAGQLMMHGYRVVVIDFFVDTIPTRQRFEEILREQLPAPPFLVGMSSYTETFEDTVRIARAVRDLFPSSPIVLGGPHATFCPEEVLEEIPFADFVILREGEGPLVELCEHLRNPRGLPLESVRGVVYREEGKLNASNAKNDFIRHLDWIPLPPYRLLPSESRTDKDDRTLMVITSRGCPGRCVFCASRAFSGWRYRTHSAEWLVSLLLAEYRRAEYDSIGVMDDTFVADRRRLRRITQHLRTLGFDRLSWTCKSRVDTIHPATLKLLHEAGCRSVHIGIESGDDEVLRSIGKNITVSDAMAAVIELRRWKMRPECSFIVGHPEDSPETLEKTVRFAKAIRSGELGVAIIGICTPFPGTELFRTVQNPPYRIVDTTWRNYDLRTPVFESDRYSTSDLARCLYHFEIESLHSPDSTLGLEGKGLEEFDRELTRFVQVAKQSWGEAIDEAREREQQRPQGDRHDDASPYQDGSRIGVPDTESRLAGSAPA